MLSKQCNLLEKEALGLVSEATDAGMDSESLTLHRAIKRMRVTSSDLIEVISNAKIRLGMVNNGNHTSLTRNLDIPPPTFSGDLKDIDFFYFSNKI